MKKKATYCAFIFLLKAVIDDEMMTIIDHA